MISVCVCGRRGAGGYCGWVCVEGGKGWCHGREGLLLLPCACVQAYEGGCGCLCAQPCCAEQDCLSRRAELVVVGVPLKHAVSTIKLSPRRETKPAAVGHTERLGAQSTSSAARPGLHSKCCPKSERPVLSCCCGWARGCLCVFVDCAGVADHPAPWCVLRPVL